VNAQTEVQKKKDEAEVQVNSLCTHRGQKSRNKECRRPGGDAGTSCWIACFCLEFVSVDLELPWPSDHQDQL
jgi:hypothetical protein